MPRRNRKATKKSKSTTTASSKLQSMLAGKRRQPRQPRQAGTCGANRSAVLRSETAPGPNPVVGRHGCGRGMPFGEANANVPTQGCGASSYSVDPDGPLHPVGSCTSSSFTPDLYNSGVSLGMAALAPPSLYSHSYYTGIWPQQSCVGDPTMNYRPTSSYRSYAALY